MSNFRRLDEKGSGTLLIAAALIIGCLLATVVLAGAAYGARVQQVSQASDLVALSAAEHGCAVAEQLAAANQVELQDCTHTGDAFDQVVTVSVAGNFSWFGFQHQIARTAYAGRLAA